ncbi:MAG: cytochrome P450 [Myxococcota bacterium]
MIRLLRLLARLEWPMRLLGPLFGRFNPLHPDRRRNPYPAYRKLRERAPVYRHPIIRIWFLSRYEDCAAVLKDPAFSVRRMELPAMQRMVAPLREDFREMITRNLLMLDPPDHTRLRALVGKAFTPRVVERLRPRIQAIVDELLDGVEAAGEMDLIRDFAYPLPVIVIAEMLGVPASDRARFIAWSNRLVAIVDPITSPETLESVQPAFHEMAAYLRGICEERRREPRDDLISALVAAEEQGDALTPAELISTCSIILGAGYETTASILGNSVMALLRNPGERKRLQDDPSLIASAVEEFLRYDPPVQATDRIAMRDCEIGGKRIRKGSLVVTLLAAANRDPARFPDPERLDLGRQDNAHLSFSHGVHFCLGAQLARAELQIALGTLLRRFPDFDGDPSTDAWRPSITLRGLTTLPLTLRPSL